MKPLKIILYSALAVIGIFFFEEMLSDGWTTKARVVGAMGFLALLAIAHVWKSDLRRDG